jgi:hypothetical protein
MKTCWWGECKCPARHNVRFKDSSVAFLCDKHYDQIAKMIQKSCEGGKFIKGSLHGQAC